MAYLTGHKEFMALDFEVTPEVLVPNPDTEVLVQRAVEWGRTRRGGALRFADVGTGSGCIAVAIAHYLPEATVDATDISSGGARRRGAKRGAEWGGDRVRFLPGDLAEPLQGPYDAVLANLPYVALGAALPAEVTAQPDIALYGGATLVNRLLEATPGMLAPAGIALLEVDPAITGELRVAGFAGWKLLKDLGGHDRVLEAWM